MNERTSSSGFQEEVIARLKSIQGDGAHEKPPVIPLIDPTANVLSLVAAAIARQDDLRTAEFRRQDDLRVQAERFNDKLTAERQRADGEARNAESGRINSLLAANTNNVALALAKAESQTSALEKRIAVLEQNQYQGVGASGQRAESGASTRWTIDKILMLAVAITGWILLLFRSKP